MPAHADRPMVVAALSGGVDSATAAALLVEAGHRVVGMTLRLYDASGTQASIGGRCCGPRDMEDARRVCAHLGIPFYVVDLADEFERRVVDDFTAAYLEGRTPNPCARCNQHIKFSPLLRRARALGADLLATGHYARIEGGEPAAWRLLRGVDRDKDQSYFLFAMPGAELGSVLFPLGGMSKEEVRRRAAELGLPNSDKPESQEICFVPDGDYAGFVERRALSRGARPLAGAVVDASGAELARHEGVHRYTIGQRRGLGLARPGGRPLYVTRIDAARAQVVVGEREDASRTRFAVGDVQWLGGRPAARLHAAVQVRHRAAPLPAEIDVAPDGTSAHVTLRDASTVAAPGQAAVFYDGDAVLGGGWIGSDDSRPRG
jgi:tRNA-uridine 2-sulfurtransferase